MTPNTQSQQQSVDIFGAQRPEPRVVHLDVNGISLEISEEAKNQNQTPTLWFSQDVLKNLDLKSLAQIEKFCVPISLKHVIVVLE